MHCFMVDNFTVKTRAGGIWLSLSAECDPGSVFTVKNRSEDFHSENSLETDLTLIVQFEGQVFTVKT
ncbi:hypothetical protein EDB99_107141 [Pseudomonas sp. 460]|nr:hypothetical protein EDB99_107141 [Pseudomonas sp. 460]